MANINSFEGLQVWQVARSLSNEIYLATQTAGFAKDFSLKDQINRAIVSVMDNIAEGFERGGNKEFIQYLSIAKGSCGEILETYFELLKDKALEISKQTSGFISYLQNSNLKGIKYISKEPETPYESETFEF